MSTSPAKKTQPPTVPRPIPTQANGRSDIDYARHTAAEATLILEALLKTIETGESNKLDRDRELKIINAEIKEIKAMKNGIEKLDTKSKNPAILAVASIYKQVADLEFKILNRAGYDAMITKRKELAQKARRVVSTNRLDTQNAELGVIGITDADFNKAPTAPRTNAFQDVEHTTQSFTPVSIKEMEKYARARTAEMEKRSEAIKERNSVRSADSEEFDSNTSDAPPSSPGFSYNLQKAAVAAIRAEKSKIGSLKSTAPTKLSFWNQIKSAFGR